MKKISSVQRKAGESVRGSGLLQGEGGGKEAGRRTEAGGVVGKVQGADHGSWQIEGVRLKKGMEKSGLRHRRARPHAGRTMVDVGTEVRRIKR